MLKTIPLSPAVQRDLEFLDDCLLRDEPGVGGLFAARQMNYVEKDYAVRRANPKRAILKGVALVGLHTLGGTAAPLLALVKIELKTRGAEAAAALAARLQERKEASRDLAAMLRAGEHLRLVRRCTPAPRL